MGGKIEDFLCLSSPQGREILYMAQRWNWLEVRKEVGLGEDE